MDIDEFLLLHPEIKGIKERILERQESLNRFERIEELLKSILLELKKLNSSIEKKRPE